MPKTPRDKDFSLTDLAHARSTASTQQMHELLMARGEIIDRLIAVKKTEETGSAFRPAREADMMRRLVRRHRGNLPLDTVESIWRVIICDLHLCAGAVRGPCRPVGGRRADARFSAFPFRLHRAVRAAYGRRERRRGGDRVERRSRTGPGLRRRRCRTVVGCARIRRRAEDHRPAAIRRTRRPSGGAAGLRGVARRRRRHGDGDRSVEHAGVRLERRRGHALPRQLPTSSPCPTAPSTARRCWSRHQRGGIDAVTAALVGVGASIRSSALVGSHATRYTVPASKPASP